MQAPVAFANAIADVTRFRVIHLLFDQTLCVCELAEILQMPQSTLSSHLRVIQKADLLDCERQGKWLFYRVKKSFRPLLLAMFRHFDIAPATDKDLARDQKKAAKCVGNRKGDCCPPPARKKREKGAAK